MNHCQSITIYDYSIELATINKRCLYLNDTNFGLDNLSNNNKNISPKKHKDVTKNDGYDIMLINESKEWQELFEEIIPKIYSYIGVYTFKDAINIINEFNLRLIFLSKPFNSNHHTRLLLKALISVDESIPVVLLNSSYENILNIKIRYPNIKEVIFKVDKGENESDRFILKIDEILKRYL